MAPTRPTRCRPTARSSPPSPRARGPAPSAPSTDIRMESSWDRAPPGAPHDSERAWRPAVPMNRRSLLAAGIALPASAWGQTWPSQPIKIVVPYPPGGLTDVLGRLSAERLQGAFGQPVIVDNKPGAATQLGASYVAKQPPDGYALLLATVSTLCITPALYSKPLITHTDFAPVAFMGNVML